MLGAENEMALFSHLELATSSRMGAKLSDGSSSVGAMGDGISQRR